MVVRGAPAIGAAGGFGLALAALQSPAADRDSLLSDLAPHKSYWMRRAPQRST